MIKRLKQLISITLLTLLCLGCDCIFGPPPVEYVYLHPSIDIEIRGDTIFVSYCFKEITYVDTAYFHPLTSDTIYVYKDPFKRASHAFVDYPYVYMWVFIELIDTTETYTNVRLHGILERKGTELPDFYLEKSVAFYPRYYVEPDSSKYPDDPILIFDSNTTIGRGEIWFHNDEIPGGAPYGARWSYYLTNRRIND